MAKRAPLGEKPFSALDKSLISSVMTQPLAAAEPAERISQQTTSQQGNTALAEAPVREPVRVELPAQPQPRPAPVLRTVPTVTARRPVVTPKPTAGEAHQEKLSREKRVLLTPAEEREIERCVDRLAEAFGGTPVKLSHVIRACLTVVRNAENEIIEQAQAVGQLTRPPNGDAVALAEFENEIGKVLSLAFRDAPLLR